MMGDRRKRRQRFFRAHPYCCFCGGETPATTEDHQPGRVFFEGRAWPEGFAFPACEGCNLASRIAEKIVALLIHGESESQDRSKYQALVASIHREAPGFIESMLPKSTNEIRRMLREKNIERPDGVLIKEIPVIKLEHELWDHHFEMFARKILLALHYQCFGVPLSHDGRLCYWIHTNVDVSAGKFPMEIVNMAEKIAIPIRQRKLLGEQLIVRWNVVADTRTALFVVLFHRMFLLSGITTENADSFSDQSNMLPPFPPPSVT